MDPTVLILVYCALVVAASLLGGALPSVVRLTHTRMQVTISFVAGLMLGVSLFLMVPHAAEATGSVEQTMLWAVLGLLAMFLLIRTFHFHEHEPVGDHGHPHPHHGHRLSWVGVLVGLSLHTAIDGVALGASVVATSDGALAGFGTFLAVALHKPLDALAITTLMTAGDEPAGRKKVVNAVFALMCPLGAALFYFGVGGEASEFVGCALAFAAGVFLCISLADLLPELQFHRHDRLKLSAALLAGVVLAYGIGRLESHGHAERPGHERHEH